MREPAHELDRRCQEHLGDTTSTIFVEHLEEVIPWQRHGILLRVCMQILPAANDTFLGMLVPVLVSHSPLNFSIFAVNLGL